MKKLTRGHPALSNGRALTVKTRAGKHIPMAEVERRILAAIKRCTWPASCTDLIAFGKGMSNFKGSQIKPILDGLVHKGLISCQFQYAQGKWGRAKEVYSLTAKGADHA